jgi:hypothetical protein
MSDANTTATNGTHSDEQTAPVNRIKGKPARKASGFLSDLDELVRRTSDRSAVTIRREVDEVTVAIRVDGFPESFADDAIARQAAHGVAYRRPATTDEGLPVTGAARFSGAAGTSFAKRFLKG